MAPSAPRSRKSRKRVRTSVAPHVHTLATMRPFRFAPRFAETSLPRCALLVGALASAGCFQSCEINNADPYVDYLVDSCTDAGGSCRPSCSDLYAEGGTACGFGLYNTCCMPVVPSCASLGGRCAACGDAGAEIRGTCDGLDECCLEVLEVFRCPPTCVFSPSQSRCICPEPENQAAH